MRLGQRQPELQTVQAMISVSDLLGFTFRMSDPLPATIRLMSPGRMACTLPRESVQNLTFEQVGHSRQVDVRMWANVYTCTSRKISRSHVVEEYPGPTIVWSEWGSRRRTENRPDLFTRLDNKFYRA